MENKNLYLVDGQIALAISILLNQFVKESIIVSFFIGLFTGLSVVFNIAYLLVFRKEKSI